MSIIRKTIFIVLILVSCKPDEDISLPSESSYFLFQRIKEIENQQTDEFIKYELVQKKLTTKERNVLIQMLREMNWDYKLTIDGDVLISTKFLTNLDNLFILEGKLDKRLASDTSNGSN